jgi:hypothetical protein
MAMAPLAQAVATDDELVRNFPYVSGARVDMDNNGIGWYDNANPPNVCLIALLGVQTPIGGTYYYEDLRTAINFAGVGSATHVGGIAPTPLACPAVLNPVCAIGCAIYVEGFTVAPLARTLLPVDTLICTQHSAFISCFLDPSTVSWNVKTCDVADATFNERAAGSNKGMLAGTGLENIVMSRQINCGSSLSTATSYNALLNDFTATSYGSGFDGAELAAHVAFGNAADDSAYVISCTASSHTDIDTSTVPPTVSTDSQDGVDWVLGLDLDAVTAGSAANWAGYLVSHLVGPGLGGQLAPGMGDLGADNDCI